MNDDDRSDGDEREVPRFGRPHDSRGYAARWKFNSFHGLDEEHGDEQIKLYLTTLHATGHYGAAAEAIGCNPREISRYKSNTPEFEMLCQDALSGYNHVIVQEARRRAVDGVEHPIIGGRNKDEIVAYEQRYSDSLMAMFLKRADPDGFRERSTVKVEATASVSFDYSSYPQSIRDQLRVLATMVKEWEEQKRLAADSAATATETITS